MKRYLAVILAGSLSFTSCTNAEKHSAQKQATIHTASTACKDGEREQAFETKDGKIENYMVFGDDSILDIAEMVCKNSKWVKDDVETKKTRDHYAEVEAKAKAQAKHEHDLWIALRTRVISDAEMKEVLELGISIIPTSEGGHLRGGCGGDCRDWEVAEAQKTAAAETVLNDALLNQFKMRTFAKDK